MTDRKLICILDDIEDAQIQLARARRGRVWLWLMGYALMAVSFSLLIVGATMHPIGFYLAFWAALAGVLVIVAVGADVSPAVHKAQDRVMEAQRAHRDYTLRTVENG